MIWLASICTALNIAGTCKYSEVLWEMPLVIVGHLYAAALKYNGVEGIGRKISDTTIIAALEQLRNQMKQELNVNT